MPQKEQNQQPLAGPQQTGVPQITYPSPDIGDLIILENVDTQGPSYQALPYQTLYPDQVNYPGYKLTLQRPINFQFVQRFWASARMNEDAYNYALQYVDEAPNKRIYIRSYVMPLADYTEVAKGSADPVDSAATITHQEMKGLGEGVDPEIANVFRLVIRVYSVLPGPVLQGQAYLPKWNITTPFTKQKVASGAVAIGTASTTIDPQSNLQDEITAINLTATQTAYLTVKRSLPGYANVGELVPPVLLTIVATAVKGQGAGVGSGSGSGTGSGSANWQWNLDQSNSSEANASAVYEFLPFFKYPWGKLTDVQDYYFFMVGPAVTKANVLSALATNFTITVAAFPKFDPEPVVFLAQGQNFRIRASARATADASSFANDTAAGNSNSSSQTTEESNSVENILRVYEYQPCIHGHITSINGLSTTQAATATADVNLGVIEAGPVSVTKTATAQVNTDIAATTITDWPSSGLTLVGLDVESDDNNLFMVRARVMDWANFR